MRKTYNVWNPRINANNSDLYLCEVRMNGWLIDAKRFVNKNDADHWGKNHKGKEVAQSLVPVYCKMINRFLNK